MVDSEQPVSYPSASSLRATGGATATASPSTHAIAPLGRCCHLLEHGDGGLPRRQKAPPQQLQLPSLLLPFKASFKVKDGRPPLKHRIRALQRRIRVLLLRIRCPPLGFGSWRPHKARWTAAVRTRERGSQSADERRLRRRISTSHARLQRSLNELRDSAAVLTAGGASFCRRSDYFRFFASFWWLALPARGSMRCSSESAAPKDTRGGERRAYRLAPFLQSLAPRLRALPWPCTHHGSPSGRLALALLANAGLRAEAATLSRCLAAARRALDLGTCTTPPEASGTWTLSSIPPLLHRQGRP